MPPKKEEIDGLPAGPLRTTPNTSNNGVDGVPREFVVGLPGQGASGIQDGVELATLGVPNGTSAAPFGKKVCAAPTSEEKREGSLPVVLDISVGSQVIQQDCLQTNSLAVSGEMQAADPEQARPAALLRPIQNTGNA